MLHHCSQGCHHCCSSMLDLCCAKVAKASLAALLGKSSRIEETQTLHRTDLRGGVGVGGGDPPTLPAHWQALPTTGKQCSRTLFGCRNRTKGFRQHTGPSGQRVGFAPNASGNFGNGALVQRCGRCRTSSYHPFLNIVACYNLIAQGALRLRLEASYNVLATCGSKLIMQVNCSLEFSSACC